MRSIPAREIKRRGIAAVDELLEEGVVYVIKNDEPRYVILTPEHYAWILDDARDGFDASVQQSLKEIREGLGREGTPEEIVQSAMERAGLDE